MAKDVFEDELGLFNELENDINGYVASNIVEEMKDIEQEVIEEVVMNQYTPSFYQRRNKGGLDDRENMKESFIKTKEGIEVCLENITKGNSKYSYADGYNNGYISDIIEEGKGYGYGLDSKIGERPFQEITQNYIDYTDRIDNVVESGLSKKGWL